MALGATSREVLFLIVGGGLKTATYGVTAGAIAAAGAALYLHRALEIRDIGLAPFIYSTAVVGAVAFMASILPAWRAALMSPIVAIRHEPESIWRTARLAFQSVRE